MLDRLMQLCQDRVTVMNFVSAMVGFRGGGYDLPVSGGIFLLSGDKLVEMREQAYDSEDLLQALLAKYSNLLAGDQLGARRVAGCS